MPVSQREARQGDRLLQYQGSPCQLEYPVREAAINARKRACAADEERRQGCHGHGVSKGVEFASNASADDEIPF